VARRDPTGVVGSEAASGGRIREMQSTCQDSKRCPPLLWSFDDQHVE
jgi:hypothetical protein